MSNTSDFKSIEAIIKNLKKNAALLTSGNLSSSEFENMINDSRDLYERLIVMRHKAFEDVVHGETEFSGFNLNVLKKKNPEKKKKENIQTAIPVEEASAQTSLLNPKHVNPEKVIKEPELELNEDEVDENQTNLLDEIDDSQSINDLLSQRPTDDTIAERMQKKPIKNLKKAIALHKKYLFINDLFAGQNDSYDYAIDRLNSFSSFDEAVSYLNELKNENGWDNESKSVVVFQELVERRYL